MKCKKGYKKSGDKCVKTNPHSKRKNKINFDALWIFVTIFGILIIAGLVFWGGSQGWFKSLTVIEDTDLISFLNNPETISQTCSLSITPNSIWVGDRTTGTIVDGKNKLCHVYVLQGGDWLSAYQGYTDSNGVLTNTRTMNFPGDYIFRAICDLNDNNRVDTSDCLTNQAELTVIPRPDDEAPEPDEGFEVGDVVGSGGVDMIMGDDAWTHFEIQLTSGDYQGDICAEIERRSSKVDPNCNPTGELEDWNEFVFLDSFNLVWERSDQIFAGVSVGPNTFGNPDIVGVRWDGVNPFRGHLYHNGPCVMNMEMRVTIKIC